MRAFVIWGLTVAMAALGAVLDLVWAAATGMPFIPSATIGLGLVGLLLGLLVARLALPRRKRPPIDPGRYPNRVIQRRS